MEDFENQVETEEEAPEGQEEQVDPVEARLQELREMEEALNKRERDLNKGFMEIADREKRISQPAAEVEEDDLPPLAPEAEKVLDRYIEKKIGPLLHSQQELYTETINTELKQISSSTGVSEDEIVETINSLGLQPRDDSLGSAREVLNAAAEIVKAKSFNPEDLEKQVREKILKELAEEGVEIKGVKPTRQLPNEAVDVASLDSRDRYEYLKAKAERQSS